VYPDNRYPKLKIYFPELIADNFEYKQYLHKNALRDLALIKLTVAGFVGTGVS
jgi:hypothetical protein